MVSAACNKLLYTLRSLNPYATYDEDEKLSTEQMITHLAGSAMIGLGCAYLGAGLLSIAGRTISRLAFYAFAGLVTLKLNHVTVQQQKTENRRTNIMLSSLREVQARSESEQTDEISTFMSRFQGKISDEALNQFTARIRNLGKNEVHFRVALRNFNDLSRFNPGQLEAVLENLVSRAGSGELLETNLLGRAEAYRLLLSGGFDASPIFEKEVLDAYEYYVLKAYAEARIGADRKEVSLLHLISSLNRLRRPEKLLKEQNDDFIGVNSEIDLDRVNAIIVLDRNNLLTEKNIQILVQADDPLRAAFDLFIVKTSSGHWIHCEIEFEGGKMLANWSEYTPQVQESDSAGGE